MKIHSIAAATEAIRLPVRNFSKVKKRHFYVIFFSHLLLAHWLYCYFPKALVPVDKVLSCFSFLMGLVCSGEAAMELLTSDNQKVGRGSRDPHNMIRRSAKCTVDRTNLY
jgi:hypothetical protein